MGRVTTLLVLAGIAGIQIASAQQDPPQWNSGTAYIAGGLVRGPDGNFYRATHNSTAHNPTTDNHSFWELYYVRASLNLTIAATKATFNSLKQAWAFVSSADIASTANVNLHINTSGGNFSETFPTGLNLNEVAGSQIQITGDNAANITLNEGNGADGFALSSGHAFGGITGVTIDGTAGASSGIHISGGASMGPCVVTIQHCGSGIFVEGHSSITCSNCSFNHPGGNALIVVGHSYALARSMTVNGNGGGSYGVFSSTGSAIDASSTSVSAMNNGGFFADEASTINANSTTVSGDTRGFISSARSFIDASSCTCTGNFFGFTAQDGGFINARSVTQSGNSTPYTPSSLNTAAADGSIIIQ